MLALLRSSMVHVAQKSRLNISSIHCWNCQGYAKTSSHVTGNEVCSNLSMDLFAHVCWELSCCVLQLHLLNSHVAMKLTWYQADSVSSSSGALVHNTSCCCCCCCRWRCRWWWCCCCCCWCCWWCCCWWCRRWWWKEDAGGRKNLQRKLSKFSFLCND